MSTAHACTCIGHQETRGEAPDMLTCADGLYCLFVILVRGKLDPDEREILVWQDFVWIGRLLFEDVVRCFTGDSGEPAPAIIDNFSVRARTALVRDASRFEPEVRAVIDAELFVGLHGADSGISDGLGGGIDGVGDVRGVRVVEEGSCAGESDQPRSERGSIHESEHKTRTETEGECHSSVSPFERVVV